MDDLRERFAGLDDIRVPDLWTDVERRLAAYETNAVTRKLAPVTGTRRSTPGGDTGSWGVGRRRTAALLAAAALIAALLIGALAAGSQLMRLTALLPSTPLPSIVPPTVAPRPSPARSVSPEPSNGLGEASWTRAADMPNVFGPGALTIVLHDGSVLVAGQGTVRGGPQSPSEAAALYEPATGRWTAVPGPAIGTASMTLLPDGRVLATGGGASARTTQLYDPLTHSWTPTANMLVRRNLGGYTATLLGDGTVLVAGGFDSPGDTWTAVRSGELYDPRSGSWSATGNMIQGRRDHTATLLEDGTVLVVGGAAPPQSNPKDGDLRSLASAEIYNPTSGTWTAAKPLGNARASHTATLLDDGTVLVAGGDGRSSPGRSAERYDPRTGHWKLTGNMTLGRIEFTSTLLRDGSVLVAGGRTVDAKGGEASASAELYDPATETWSPTATLTQARRRHAGSLLPDGRVLLVGGQKDQLSMNWLASSELYVPGDAASTP